MKLPRLVLLVTPLLFTICAADLFQYVGQISTCGLNCLSKTIPASECQTFTNSTCICSSKTLLETTDACMSTKCTVLERLDLAKINEEACGLGLQHRRVYDWIGMGLLDILGPVFFTLRIWFRYKMTKKMEVDDWVLVATFIVWLPFTILGVIIRIIAIGYNIWDLKVETITLALKLFFVDELLYTLTLALLRISILFFIMKVFQQLRIWCWATMAFVITSATIIIAMTLFQCLPIDFNWAGWKGDYPGSHKCIDVNALSYAAAASGICQDLIILILPLPVISTLQMHMRKKILTLLMFSLGIFIVITSCIRLKSLVQFAKSLNPTWDYVDAVLWTSLEVNISVAVVCLPSIRMFLAQKLPNIFGSINNSKGSKKTKESNLSSIITISRRNQYADLPDRNRAQGAGGSNTWEQDSIELDGKVTATSVTHDNGSETHITAGSPVTNTHSNDAPINEAETEPPVRHSWSSIERG